MKKMRRYVIAALFWKHGVSGCSTIGQTAGAKADGKTLLRLLIGFRCAGETVKVTLVPPSRANTPSQATEHKVTIKEDGTIALPNFPRFRLPARLQRTGRNYSRECTVPDYWTSLGVTVEPDARFFYVGGEVTMPKRMNILPA